MALAVEKHWPAEAPLEGIALTRYAHGLPTSRIRVIADVTGDGPTHIASGPCSADPTTYAESVAILAKYSIEAPLSVRWRLESGAEGRTPETPKPGDPALGHVETRVIGTAHRSLEA